MGTLASSLAVALAVTLAARPVAAQDPVSRDTTRVVGAARVSGVVFDSTASAPLGEAVVQLVSTSDVQQARTARTDATGGFAFRDVAPGRYLLGFVHPRLQAVLLEPPVRALTVADADAVVPLAVPSRDAIARAACGDPSLREESTPILGRVTTADGLPLREPARVTITWSEITIGRGLRTTRPTPVAETDADGIYRLCAAPAHTNLQLTAATGTARRGSLALTTPADGLLLQDLVVGASDRVPLADDDPDVTVLRGPGQLTGQIVTRADPQLDTVRVFAKVDPFDWRTEFAARRSRGLGRFLDEAMIARRNPQRTSELLDLLPEISIRRARSMAEEQVVMRDASGSECIPDLFIDGMRLFLDGANVDSYVSAYDLADAEIHRTQALRPLRFVTENPCGAIVLWTGRRTPAR